ncbi:XRE family transcriptional regulator [Marinitoga sp. 1197]|uniref:helix-turn-helix domain-containing protein n=1 Tax=Marinitoga sp. 1197 TaxID=1428449 RepID=UPI000640BFA8|nr:helix-turn-helix transcriptional regulator [Marinitoga sp. 1197]KLO23986.1 XRE family transcriptional regulator [Marinitoga sp. 1197]
MSKVKLYDFDEYKKQALKRNSKLKEKYDDLDLKYQVIAAVIEYRKKNNLTQQEFARKIGISQQALSRFERGIINPRVDFLNKILRAAGKTVIIK